MVGAQYENGKSRLKVKRIKRAAYEHRRKLKEYCASTVGALNGQGGNTVRAWNKRGINIEPTRNKHNPACKYRT
jgi:hypothetical protein